MTQFQRRTPMAANSTGARAKQANARTRRGQAQPRKRSNLPAGLLQLTLALFRALLPPCTVIFLALVSFVALTNPTFKLFVPFLVFPAAYYWMIQRPGALPIFVLFLIGLFVDALTAAPIGMSAIMLLLMSYLIDQQRLSLVNASIWRIWLLFAGLIVGGFALSWLVMSILHGSLFGTGELAIRTLATVLSYPLVYLILSPLDRLLLTIESV